MESDRVENNCK